MFFFTPEIYLVQLSAVLVDGKVNHDNWKTLITQLQDDWMASITPVSVLPLRRCPPFMRVIGVMG